MRILFLTDNFPPEVNAPASRTYEHSREWVAAGHEVTVVTCAPNFPKGRVFPGYRNRLWSRETVDGINVIRVWSYISANEGFLKRTLDYASFMASAILAAPFLGRADLVVGTSPQFFAAIGAWMISALKRRPFVFELRDLWPESIRAVGALKSDRLLRWLERLELFLYRRAAMVVAVTESFRSNLIARGIDPARIVVVTNGADLSRFSPRPKDGALSRELGLEGKFVAGYVGTHGMAHGLDTLLEAAARLGERGWGDRTKLILIGDGAAKEALRRRRDELDLDNVILLDPVSKEEIPRYWSLLDASIIHLKKDALFETVIPSKLFESMAMGVPVLHGVTGESAEIVQREQAGLLFAPESPNDLADRIVELASNSGLREELARKAREGVGRYDRRVLAAEMARVFETVVSPAGRKAILRNGERVS
ncbi:MAG: glycosyltransferase family 4 protein [Bauldia sp.]|nr:glycosyltransferase family 4 protein [Bauldia sp.]